MRRSLAIAEKALGPEHSDVGASLHNLAKLYEVQGRYPEAEPVYRRSLTIFEKVLGPAHPHVGTVLDGLAQLYQVQGRFAEAEPLYKRSLAILEKALGASTPMWVRRSTIWRSCTGTRVAMPRPNCSISAASPSARTRWGQTTLMSGRRLTIWAAAYWYQGRHAEAEPL